MPPINPTVALALALPTALALAFPAQAQISPDTSLPLGERSVIEAQGNIFQIRQGAQRGSNLFHSFEQFSVPTGASAVFANGLDIQNIFSRVTGSSASLIDGGLGANGAANLFFLNPNGVLFGPNASLNLGGSFIAATANRIDFQDGTAWGLGEEPLLTIARPIGLSLQGSAGAIEVRDGGNHFTTLSSFFLVDFPIVEINALSGVEVQPGQTLALVSANEISIDGGLLRAPDGRIDIATAATARLAQDALGVDVRPEGPSVGSILVTGAAALDVTGLQGGLIQVEGSDMRFEDRTFITTGALGAVANPASSGIQFRGDRLVVDGTTPPYEVGRLPLTPVVITTPPTVVISQSAAAAGGLGPIVIDVAEISIQNGSPIASIAVSGSEPSDILASADSINISGRSPEFIPYAPSFFTLTSPRATSDGGDIEVNTDSLSLSDDGIIFTFTAGTRDAGDILINADAISITGSTDPEATFLQSPTAISSSSGTVTPFPIESGSSGNITINARTIDISSDIDSAGIIAISTSEGNAGDVTVRASEAISIRSNSPDQDVAIGSAVVELAPSGVISVFGVDVSDEIRGDAGTVIVEAPLIYIQGPGEGQGLSTQVGISAANASRGDAGTVFIRAEELSVVDGGQILAATGSGEGGNIDIESGAILLSNAEISANARGQGTGGNILATSDLLALLDGSSITANAEDARGGRVEINSNSLLQSNDSIISATSALGPEFDGEVVLNILFSTNPTEATIAVQPAIEARSTSGVCQKIQDGDFVISGRGGMPISPESNFSVTPGWNEPEAPSSGLEGDEEILAVEDEPRLTVADGMVLTPEGLINFVGSEAPRPVTATCGPLEIR